MNNDTHEGHPEAGYRMEDISKELKKHGGDVNLLIDLLTSRYQLDREKAVDYLGKIGDPEAVPALIEALGDLVINWIAAESLGKIRAYPGGSTPDRLPRIAQKMASQECSNRARTYR